MSTAMRMQTWRAGWYRTMASDATSHSRANDFCPLHMTVCKCAHDVLAHAGSASEGGTGRPSRARFRPASAAQAPHGAGHILLQAAGTADCSSARPPDLPTARPAFRPLHALRRQRCAIRYVIFEQFALPVMTKSIVWKKVTNRCVLAD